MHACMHACMYTYRHTYIQVQTHTDMIYIYTYIHIHPHSWTICLCAAHKAMECHVMPHDATVCYCISCDGILRCVLLRPVMLCMYVCLSVRRSGTVRRQVGGRQACMYVSRVWDRAVAYVRIYIHTYFCSITSRGKLGPRTPTTDPLAGRWRWA